MNVSRQSSGPATEREIFLAALERENPADRSAFLDSACHGDAGLRQRLTQLLQEHDTVGGFLEAPAACFAASGSSLPPGSSAEFPSTEQPGDFIGRYKLLEKIGEGGWGVVYMAEQREPVRRRVALKVIKLGMDTRSVIARFEAERQALALMDHPCIARVLDAGATENGRPFFVMELVRGVRITDFCNENELPSRERLKLFIQVCQAMEHAHQKGIIHRDLKPSNILVSWRDGVPAPKIIDFGIAKATGPRLTEKTLFTEFHSFIGTPAYMSPEQAEMTDMDVDTRADIYALGVLLYELLVGHTPFDPATLAHSGIDECRRTICDVEPVRPSTRLESLEHGELTRTARQRHSEPRALVRQLKGDLDWIAMKCLEKDRRRRYATAGDLAADIRRYLDNEPVHARPPSAAYRFWKFARRNRVGLLAGGVVGVAILVGAGISAWQAVRATRAEHLAMEGQEREKWLRHEAELESGRAREEKRLAQLNEYIADINLASQSLALGNLGRAIQLLDKHQPEADGADLRGFEWHYLRQLGEGNEHIALPAQPGGVESIACSPDGGVLAIGLHDSFAICDLASRTIKTNIAKGAVSMGFLPNGKHLVTASRSNVRVWRRSDWTQETMMADNFGPIAISSDGSRLAANFWEGVRLWNTADWKETVRLPGAGGPIAFSPDGRMLASDSRNGVTLWECATGRRVRVLEDSARLFFYNAGQNGNARMMAFSPNGKSLVTVRIEPSSRGVFVLSVWDVESGRETAVLPDDPQKEEHTGIISSMAFSPEGQTLATASWDHSIRLWDFVSGRRSGVLQGHVNEVWAVAFTPDGRYVASGSRDGGVFLWPMQPARDEFFLPGNWSVRGFTPDNRCLIVEERDRLGFLNLGTREVDWCHEVGEFAGPGMPWFSRHSISRDAETLAWLRDNGTVCVETLASGRTCDIPVTSRPVDSLALSPDGRWLILTHPDGVAGWWDLRENPKQVDTVTAERVCFSPDGRRLAVFSHDKPIQVLDGATRRVVAVIGSEPAPSFTVAFSPGGTLLATVGGTNSNDNEIRLWDAASGLQIGKCSGHKQKVWAVAFSPDGRTLASSSDDSTVRLWNVATRQELLSVRRLGTTLTSLAFSPDGRMLAGGSSPFSRQCGLRLFMAQGAQHAPTPNTAR
jgi:WD40 repeat protein